ncbi:UbiA-like polyprenyltransferase [Paludibaculum fermentans]|uniref:UbiA-like polyprenyltransferase n=1 Tax=Paludibaculum fermentans TaxID=1473598 RepID=UPI003EBDBF8C
MHQATSSFSPPALWRRLVLTLDMIRFEHSVFALPFALTGALLGWRAVGYPLNGMAAKLGWIVLAMVGARSAAMAFNRVLDADIDARNPRTKARHIPAGLLSRTFAWGFIAATSAVFLLAAGMLNPLCFRLAPVALGVVFFYSWTKRFTPLSHVVLGFALGIAPSAAWIAMTGSLDPRIIWLTAAVTLWTAGFDIIYSCQDYEFDQREGLFSLPAKLGIAGALLTARFFHIAMIACLAILALSLGGGIPAWLGIGVVAALLLYEHSLVHSNDLSRVDAAFFTVNGWVGMLFFGFWAFDILSAMPGLHLLGN